MLTDEKRTQLLQDLGAGDIENPIEFLRYMNRALVFDLRDYSLNPYEYFPQIHEAIAQMLFQTGVADVRFDDFRLELVESPDFDGNAIVSVHVNGQHLASPPSHLRLKKGAGEDEGFENTP